METHMRSSLLALGRPGDFSHPHFPPHILRHCSPHNRERAYARLLRPIVSCLWKQRFDARLGPPMPHPLSRAQAYSALCGPDLSRPDLFRPALYLQLAPHLSTLPLLQLRCQGSLLPAHRHLCPSLRRYRPYADRHCHLCPYLPPGPGAPPPPPADVCHALFHCPSLRLVGSQFMSDFAALLHDFGVAPADHSDPTLLSLALAVDPRIPLSLSRVDRHSWLRALTPLAAAYACSLHAALASTPASP